MATFKTKEGLAKNSKTYNRLTYLERLNQPAARLENGLVSPVVASIL